jgi:pimeloyl-ACP methyl ester carboxylesterase
MTQLAPPVPGDAFEIEVGAAGPVAAYRDGARGNAPPLVLVHSLNAAASAYEVRPVYLHAARTRPTYALDLPGFGRSPRRPQRYTIRAMTDAIAALIDRARDEHGGGPVDVLAVSLGCELAARAVVERPERARRLILVSPTGLDGRGPYLGPTGTSREVRCVSRALIGTALGRGSFAALRRPRVIRYFLAKTFGRDRIDEGLFDYAVETTRVPGAEHAPLAFLSACLFAADATALYRALTVPTWIAHGTRGDFTDYRGIRALPQRPELRVTALDSGALPYFEPEIAPTFFAELDAFLAEAAPAA